MLLSSKPIEVTPTSFNVMSNPNYVKPKKKSEKLKFVCLVSEKKNKKKD